MRLLADILSKACGAASAKIGPASAVDVFAISAVAKLGATVLTYPLQLIKARLQSAGKHTHSDRRYTGTLDAVLRIWQNEGGILLNRIHCLVYMVATKSGLLQAFWDSLGACTPKLYKVSWRRRC